MHNRINAIGVDAAIGVSIAEKMQVLHFDPPRELEPYVTRIYHFRYEDKLVEDVTPAALGQLAFLLEGNGYLEFADGHRDRAQPATLYGPGTAAMKVKFDGPLEHFGVAFSPLGFVAITGKPASDYADRAVSAYECFGPEIDDLAVEFRARRRAGPLNYNDMIADLTLFLLSRVKAVPLAHKRLIDTVLQWILSDLSPDVEDLYAQLLMSRSTAARLIARYFGSTPKMQMRKYRSLRAASIMIDPETPDELRKQVEALFYDKPHMIREFRQFTGRTPGALNNDDVQILKHWLTKGNNKLPDPKAG